MSRGKCRLASFLFACIVALTGMCFGNAQADSLDFCAPAETADTFLSSGEPVMEEVAACTTEMLGVHNDAAIQKLSNEPITLKRELKAFTDFLFISTFSLQEREINTSLEGIQFGDSYPEEPVVEYIHKSDGKKQI